MSNEFELPPPPSGLMEALRDTGYVFNTALADIVDNSIDADADKIDIFIDLDVLGDILICVSDNGHGMNEPKLKEAMTYGAHGSESPQRLGKFGLGLKTASTAFCRKLSVISRDSSTTTAIKATWDLDHVAKTGKWFVLFDAPTQDENERLNKIAGNGSGTVVSWSNVDRLFDKAYSDPGGAPARKALKNKIDDFKFHISMVYQRFLDKEDTRPGI